MGENTSVKKSLNRRLFVGGIIACGGLAATYVGTKLLTTNESPQLQQGSELERLTIEHCSERKLYPSSELFVLYVPHNLYQQDQKFRADQLKSVSNEFGIGVIGLEGLSGSIHGGEIRNALAHRKALLAQTEREFEELIGSGNAEIISMYSNRTPQIEQEWLAKYVPQLGERHAKGLAALAKIHDVHLMSLDIELSPGAFFIPYLADQKLWGVEDPKLHKLARGLQQLKFNKTWGHEYNHHAGQIPEDLMPPGKLQEYLWIVRKSLNEQNIRGFKIAGIERVEDKLWDRYNQIMGPERSRAAVKNLLNYMKENKISRAALIMNNIRKDTITKELESRSCSYGVLK